MRFNAILKTKRVYMLYLLPFILAAIAFLRFTFVSYHGSPGGGLCLLVYRCDLSLRDE